MYLQAIYNVYICTYSHCLFMCTHRWPFPPLAFLQSFPVLNFLNIFFGDCFFLLWPGTFYIDLSPSFALAGGLHGLY